jgi:integrase
MARTTRTYVPPVWLPEWVRIYNTGRLSYWDEFAVGKGVRRHRRCGTITAAENLARQLVAQADRSDGLTVALGSTWKDLAQSWVDAHDGRLPEGTFRRRYTAINAWIVPIVGDVDVTTTGLPTLLAVADRLVADGAGISNFDSVTQTMNVIAQWGRARSWLPPDPLGADGDRRYQLRRLRAQVRLQAERKGIAIHQVPTWQEVCEWSDAVERRVATIAKSEDVGAQFGRAIRIYAGSGLRLAELLGLTGADVNLEQGTISVTKQLNRYVRWEIDQPMPTAPPKHKRIHEALVWAKVKSDLEAVVAFVENPHAPLFAPYRNQGRFADAWSQVMKETRNETGWPWTPHFLRHHYGSYSLAPRSAGGLGMPAVEVQLSMGHADLSTTLNTYIQPTRQLKGWAS